MYIRLSQVDRLSPCKVIALPARLEVHSAVDFMPQVYNTLWSVLGRPSERRLSDDRRRMAVIRCPECSAEIDVDEDEVEEGEILSCPECESELEVSQTHPVHLNIISEDLDEDEDDEEEDDEVGENGDLLEEDEDDEEADDEDDEE
jgi:alpha-aminoadipate/glutamate carrier protein LysW